MWQYFWSWLQNGGPASHYERGSKTAVIKVFWLKITRDKSLTVSEIKDNHLTMWLLLRPASAYQPGMQQEILLSIMFTSASGVDWWCSLMQCDTHWWRLIDLRQSLRFRRWCHRTVCTDVLPKFVRSMSHSVACTKLIRLLKSHSL